jgi:serine phosphatase RsbU (regulator of sigma subunit)/predicted enzyme related to lactoylglutathione lyase
MSSSTPRVDRDPLYLRVLCVNIYVRDQDKSLRFFVDQLGFKLIVDENFESSTRWVAVAPPDGSTIIGLVTPKRNSEEFRLIGKARHTVFVTEDVVAKFEEWQKLGVKFHHPPQTTLFGGVFTRFDDIDGNNFMLLGRDEFVREIEAQRRAAAEKLEAERRTAQELEIAKRVQERLFPQKLPPMQTLEYAGACVQARQVGGDYFDFLNLGRERLGIVIGDTSGKGIGAALLMANLQANLRSQSATALGQPQQFLQSVNKLFCENTSESSYATLCFAEYDDRTRRLRYANCGHYSPILLRGDGSIDRLDSTATVLGLFSKWECAVEQRALAEGDILSLFTDGITEAFNEDGEEFGEDRLIEALRRYRDRPANAILEAIIEEVRKFSPGEQFDDITLIVAKGVAAT